MNKICEIDDKALQRTLDYLNEENRKKAIFKSLKKGGELLVEKTRQILIRKMPKAATTTKHKKPIAEGVHLGKSDKDYLEVLVTLLGEFRTKWFETGTKLRKLLRSGAKDRSRGRFKGDKRYWYRKKGKENQYVSGTNRGKIEGLHFFRDARENYNQDIVDAIQDSLEQEINRLLKKN